MNHINSKWRPCAGHGGKLRNRCCHCLASVTRWLACDRLGSQRADHQRHHFSPLISICSMQMMYAARSHAIKVNALVHAAGFMRFGELGRLGPCRRYRHVAGKRGGGDAARRYSGPKASTRGPHRADRQPHRFGRRGPQPVCRHQVGADRDGTFVGDGARATRHHGQCRISDCDGNADAARSWPQQLAAASSPDRAFCQPEEVAAVTAFLLSEEAGSDHRPDRDLRQVVPVICSGYGEARESRCRRTSQRKKRQISGGYDENY